MCHAVLILRRGEVTSISSSNVKLFYETYLLKGACSSCLHEAIIVHFEVITLCDVAYNIPSKESYYPIICHIVFLFGLLEEV